MLRFLTTSTYKGLVYLYDLYIMPGSIAESFRSANDARLFCFLKTNESTCDSIKARVEEQSMTLAFFICKEQIHLLIGRGDGHEQNCVTPYNYCNMDSLLLEPYSQLQLPIHDPLNISTIFFCESLAQLY